ncbi:hypothetical protein [Bacillus sp. E214]|nr:hypothetical protein [Bacillus sp. E214]
MRHRRRNRNGFFKESLFEIIGEIIWEILMFIPRMIIRFISNIFD